MGPNDTVKMFVGLPTQVVGPVEIGRLSRELEILDNQLLQQHLRGEVVKLPPTTRFMDELISLNKLDLVDETQRQRTRDFLAMIKDQAPLLHMSFSADPPPVFIEKLMTWLRANIHPLVLLTVGLQPNIGAGALLRTTNKYYDFSLGKHFSENRELLMQKLNELNASPASSVALEVNAEPVS